MNLNEAKELLKKSGYRLINERLCPPKVLLEKWPKLVDVSPKFAFFL